MEWTLKDVLDYRRITTGQFARLMGVNKSTVEGWLKPDGLKGNAGTAAADHLRDAGLRGSDRRGRADAGSIREERMSRNKKTITRKRFCRLLAATNGLQVQECRDMVRKALVEPILRAQEKMHTAQHRKELAE